MYEFRFCRRCGSEFDHHEKHVYKCPNGHTIYANASPAVALMLFNQRGDLATLTRAINPGKGQIDFPGGFCDGEEAVDQAVFREIEEEIGVKRNQYSNLQFLHSGIDHYDLDGESIPVVSIIFRATLEKDVILQPDDDAASAEFKSLDQIDRECVYFDSLREAFDKIREDRT